MKTKHTKGEWVATADISPKGQKMIFAKGTNILIAFVQPEDVDSDEERDSNAKLIAAAPELLEALIKINEMCADSSNIENGKLNIGQLARISINAINKATN